MNSCESGRHSWQGASSKIGVLAFQLYVRCQTLPSRHALAGSGDEIDVRRVRVSRRVNRHLDRTLVLKKLDARIPKIRQ